MKYFLIKYSFQSGSQKEWHQEIQRFISALDGDPFLKDKIAYRSFRKDKDYFHLAAAADEQTVKALQEREFFARYTKNAELVGGGEVDVLPLEPVAETKFQAGFV